MQNSETSQNIYTLQFFLLCFSSVLFLGSFNMIIPELPNYLTDLGGAEYKGLIISLFTLTAGISRPFSGKLADTIGRMPVMVFGVLVCVIIGFLYPILTSVAGFLFLRLAHGFSTGFKPTGTSAYLADIVPANKRGEALGILGVSGSIGMASGPAFGSYLAQAYNIEVMFYASSAVALFSILILAGMKETLPNKQSFSPKLLLISPKDVFDKRVALPSLIMLLTTYSFGTLLTIIPDFSDFLKVSNRGYFFSVMLISSILVRAFAGRASDIYGRKNLLMAGTLLLAIGMTVVSQANSISVLFTGAVIVGLSVGINSPTVFAWTVDLVDPKFRGRGMATMYIAMEIGVGLGALLSGLVYANNPLNFMPTFAIGAILSAFACFHLVWLTLKHKK